MDYVCDIHVVGLDAIALNNSLVVLFRIDANNRPASYCLGTFSDSMIDLENGHDPKIISLSLISFKKLQFTAVVSSNQALPIFRMSSDRLIAYICLPDRLVIASPDVAGLEESIPWKAKDLLGVGLIHDTDKGGALLLSGSGGILHAKVSLSAFRPDSSSAAPPMMQIGTEDVSIPQGMAMSISTAYSKLEQIVFFSGHSDNPIALTLNSSDGDLNQPCLDLCVSIVDATNPNLPNIVDEGYFLGECFSASHNIIQAVNRVGMISKLSDSTRFTLLFSAEKISVMRDLWTYQNSIYAKGSVEDQDLMLENAIHRFMQKKGLSSQGGIRDFFRAQIGYINQFLSFLPGFTQEITQNGSQPLHQSVYECGKILNVCFCFYS
jgi:hypothetical protein